MPKAEASAPIFLHMPEEMRVRLQKQAARFGASESMLIRMAVTKWLEEEEAKQNDMRKVKLIPKG
ncbi:MAG: hypothetical protein WC346_19885 [Methanogenium sp.]